MAERLGGKAYAEATRRYLLDEELDWRDWRALERVEARSNRLVVG